MAVVFERPSLWRRFVPFLKGFDFWLLLSVCMLAGMGLMLAGTLLGVLFWGRSHYSGVPTTAGGVMLVALQIIVGMQMMLGFLAYDIAAVPRRPLHRLLVALKPGGDTTP